MADPARGAGRRSEAYRPDIDGLRAVSVGAVLLCHAFPQWVPGGFIGVDIFFVISGYLISRIILGDIEAARFSVLDFYKRRIRRIFPALLVLLAANLIVGWYGFFPPEFRMLGQHIVASALFYENFLLWSEVGYFNATSLFKPMLHLWSLAIEEQFYIVWPLILFLTRRWNRAQFALLVGLAAVSFAINLHDIRTDPTGAYYSPFGRSWELLVGAGLCFFERHRPGGFAAYRDARSICGIALIALALPLHGPQSAFPGFWALLPTLGAALLISAGPDAVVNRRLLSLAPMVGLGLISYPVYLWHWFFLSHLRIMQGPQTPLVLGLCLVAAVVLGALTFLLIEQPLRALPRGNGQPLVLLAAMCGVVAIASGAANGTIQPRLYRFQTPDKNAWSFLRQVSGINTRNMEGVYRFGGSRPDAVLFIGDSHMAQYTARLDRLLAADPGRPAAVLAIGGTCIPVQSAESNTIRRPGCAPLRDKAFRLANEAQYKRIVIGGAWNTYLLQGDFTIAVGGKRVRIATPEGRKAMLDQLASRVRQWQRAGKDVVFVLDEPRSHRFLLNDWRLRLGRDTAGYPASATVRAPSEQMALRRELEAWAVQHGMVVIDPFSAICREDVCRATTADGMPLYMDYHHFNPDWVVTSADFIDSTLAPISPGAPHRP